MSTPFFRFKQFTVRHDRCAMKVGTDGVLLGAWAPLCVTGRVLDVGTGTGLVALMLAQRGAPSVVALEIDPSAALQAAENVSSSPWADRIRVVQGDFRTFTSPQPFHLIVSNPPYFVGSLHSPDSRRTTARHADGFTSADLVRCAAPLLVPGGCLAVVIPMDARDALVGLAAAAGLVLRRQLDVVTTPGALPKRVLLAFEKADGAAAAAADGAAGAFHHQTLLVELSRHVYSPDYIALTRDFYLKM